jgi:hypothetical protein
MTSPKIWIFTTLLTFATPMAAEASIPALNGPLNIPLNVQQESTQQRYSDHSGGACLVLDAGRPLGDQDAAGLHQLIQDLNVVAGPGLQAGTEPAGSVLYTYNLIPVLQGTRLIYRGLLSSKTRGNSVEVSSRGPASLNEVVERDLGFTGAVSLVFSRDCN